MPHSSNGQTCEACEKCELVLYPRWCPRILSSPGNASFTPKRRVTLRAVPAVAALDLLGDSKRVAADHYVYALTDYREVDRRIALARL